MSEKTFLDSIQSLLQYHRSIGFGLSLLGVFFIDLTIASVLPFWFVPLLLGIIAGIIIGSIEAGLFAGLGAMAGRFISMIIMILTTPGIIKTMDLFLAAIGDVLGTPLPPGSLIVIFLSIIICGLFGLVGGFVGGSAIKLMKNLNEYRHLGK